MLVSIIVPIYNVEKYLKRCLKSIINQTYSNLEIILVNDGSTDNSLKIAKNFKSDHRVKIINQKNQGLSAARNHGIEIAKGDYIALIDSDDCIEPDFIKNLVDASFGVDIVISGYKILSQEGKLTTISLEDREISGKNATIELLTQQKDYQILAWNKLYSRKLFQNIKYPEGKNHEDNLTTYKLVSAAKNVKFINSSNYIYYKRKDSITGLSKISDSLKIKHLAALESKKYFNKDKELSNAAEIAILLADFSCLDHILNKKILDPENTLFTETVEEIKNKYKTLKNNPFLSLKLRFYILALKTPKSSLYIFFRKIKHS